MKKIPSLFLSNEHQLTREVNPLCQWVIDGEGVPTAKLDGTACAVIQGKLYKRYDNSKLIGKTERVQRTAPLKDWIHCQDTTERGRFIYWIPVSASDYYHQIAWAWGQGKFEDGTYELVGPNVQANPHKFKHNALIKHGSVGINNNPRSYEEIKNYLEHSEWEGIVWHHPDGRMSKITKAKFGFFWHNQKEKE